MPIADQLSGFDTLPCIAGIINLSSPDHISLLVHRTFNVSVPRHHITTDSYEFEYGPAENDPEFGPGPDESVAEGAVGEEGAEGQIGGGGRWVHKVTGIKLGDSDGYLEFTVVGYVPIRCNYSWYTRCLYPQLDDCEPDALVSGVHTARPILVGTRSQSPAYDCDVKLSADQRSIPTAFRTSLGTGGGRDDGGGGGQF